MAPKNTAPDIDSIARIMTVGIIATLLLTAVVGVLFVAKYILPQDTAPQQHEEYPSGLPQKTLQSQNNKDTAQAEMTGDKAAVDNNMTGKNDSAKLIEHYIPDDPWYSTTEFNNTPPPDTPPDNEILQTLFDEKYTMEYTPVSLRATVGKGPLVVEYNVDAGSENLNPYYSFLEISVSDYETGEILATGGYARNFPSQKEQSIEILSTGDFRIDVYGNGLELDLKVMSGISQESVQKQTVPETPDEIPNIPEYLLMQGVR